MQSIPKKQLVLGAFICTIAATFYCYEYLLRIIPGALQAQLRYAFGHINATAFGNLSAYYYYAYTPMQLPVGMLMDRFGPRKLLFLACFICSIGSFMFTYTSSIAVASMGRFLVGFGSAFAFVGVLSLASVWLPKRYFSFVAGLVTTLGMIGAIIGEVSITVAVERMGWKEVLYIAAWVGIVLTLLIFIFVKDSPDGKGVVRKMERSFFTDVAKVLSCGQVWLAGTVGSLLYMSLSVFAEIWGQTYLKVVHHLSNYDAATAISMVFLGWAIGAPLAGFISDWTRKRIAPLVIGAIFGALSISVVLYVTDLPIFMIKLMLFLYGVFCSAEIIIFIMGKENSDAKLSGTAFAVVNMIVMLGGAIFQPLVGYFLDVVWSGELMGHTRVYATSDYQLVLSILPIGLLLVIILSFFLKENVNKT
jgi:MFS family permease